MEIFAYLGMGFLILGITILLLGWMRLQKGKVMGWGALLLLAGILFAVFGTPYRNPPSNARTMVALGFGCIGFVIVSFILDRVKNSASNKEMKQKKADSIGATALDRFFVECVLAGANDFSKQKNVQRAQLLADKYKLKYPKGIETLYKQGLEGHKTVSQRFVENDLEEQRAKEREEFTKLNKYSNLTGKAKRITMLTDRANELRNSAKSTDDYADALMRSGQQREMNWASWGGAASGLAGPGAGIATAADIQMKNMQIRAENEQRRQAAMPAYLFLSRSANDSRKNADRIMQEIKDFKLKLISDDRAEDLMKQIRFTNTDVLVSKTGAALVCTCATLDPKFRIFDDVPAVVDGTLIAKIYDGNKLCGTAQLVLPLYGVGENVPLQGICIDCCQPGKTYTVKYSAKHLWALEK